MGLAPTDGRRGGLFRTLAARTAGDLDSAFVGGGAGAGRVGGGPRIYADFEAVRTGRVGSGGAVEDDAVAAAAPTASIAEGIGVGIDAL